jgi:hypothetical protein
MRPSTRSMAEVATPISVPPSSGAAISITAL